MRRVLTALAVIALLGLFAGPVGAASPPANDEATGATVIPTTSVLPFSTTEVTTGATANPATDGCGGEATVWYQYTPATSDMLAIDASQSSYAVGLSIFTGSPGNLNLLACGGPQLVFGLPEITTYYLMFSEVDGLSTGGTLAFTLENAPPPPSVHLTISPTGSADPKAGTVTISGTVDCGPSSAAGVVPFATGGGPGVFINVFVSQKVGRIATIQGFGAASLPCASGTAWSTLILPNSGLFKPGQVSVQAEAVGCDAFGQCSVDDQAAAVRVTKG